MKKNIKAEELSEFAINSKYLNIGQYPDTEDFFILDMDFTNNQSGILTNVTDFNVWKRVLSWGEMENWTNCNKTSYGDIVNWNEIIWDTLSMYKNEANHSMICDDNKTVVRVQPTLSFSDSQIQSKAFRGKHLVMVDNQTQKDVLDLMKTKGSKCKNSK